MSRRGLTQLSGHGHGGPSLDPLGLPRLGIVLNNSPDQTLPESNQAGQGWVQRSGGAGQVQYFPFTNSHLLGCHCQLQLWALASIFPPMFFSACVLHPL